jgi:hypothetical protein
VGSPEVRTSLNSNPRDAAPRIERWTATGDWTARAQAHLLYL